jgi:hypothetical protein
MTEPSLIDATYVGQVSAVRGGVVQVRLRTIPSTLVMIDGSSHRIGQIGAFVRIPLGYTQLYGVCTQVGADGEAPVAEDGTLLLETEHEPRLTGFRWMTVALFGESVERRFDRGVGQYPTVGDEVHVVTSRDLDVIYAQRSNPADVITIGRVAGSDSVPAALSVSAIVNRHACVVGSTGSGKSNLVAVVLRALAAGSYESARVLVVDPHGEYSTALPPEHTQTIGAGTGAIGARLRVPYWALSFDELMRITMGAMSESNAEHVRERLRTLKVEAASQLADPPPEAAITADAPIPFSIRRLWFELRNDEDVTYKDKPFGPDTESTKTAEGNPEGLKANVYPPAGLGTQAPFLNPQRRNIGRQLDFMRSRLLDSRFKFMFDNSDGYHPSKHGKTTNDLDQLLSEWLGSDKPITVIDVAALPVEVLGVVVGTMLNLIYEALYWGTTLPVGGKEQPLLLVIDEAHRFLPRDTDTAASRACGRIAKEGRKYGVGLVVVTQRPSDIDPTVLSQCGTMIALRVTNGSDRAAVAATVPDDLGGLTALLPSLRTGEGLVLGDALQVPSRVRIDRAPARPVGDDPKLPDAWLKPRPSTSNYATAVKAWRAQTMAAVPATATEEKTR